jgi:uncharacterized membrane protein
MALSVKETIEKFTNENGFFFGIDTAMQAIRPNCSYEVSAHNGKIEITRWENNWSEEKGFIDPPSPDEIMVEYRRQEIIAECIEYFKNK